MKNVLKVWLKKNHYSVNPNEYEAQVSVNEYVELDFIIDEMVKDGLNTDREVIIDLISRFNRKASELVVSGYQVNTGLVKMQPCIKGNITQRIWNPIVNRVDVLLSQSEAVTKAIEEVEIEIIETPIEFQEIQRLEEIMSLNRVVNNRVSLLNNTEKVPACGMAFRTWLCE